LKRDLKKEFESRNQCSGVAAQCPKSVSNHDSLSLFFRATNIVGRSKFSDWFFLGKFLFFHTDCFHGNGYKKRVRAFESRKIQCQ